MVRILNNCEGDTRRIDAIITMDAKGQIVLPKDLREKAKFKPNDKIAVVACEKNGEVCCIMMIKASTLAGGSDQNPWPTSKRSNQTGELMMKEEKIKKIVRNRYAKVAKTNGSCCASNLNCCSAPTDKQMSKMAGYGEEETTQVPEGANLGLGCGNPTALAS